VTSHRSPLAGRWTRNRAAVVAVVAGVAALALVAGWMVSRPRAEPAGVASAVVATVGAPSWSAVPGAAATTRAAPTKVAAKPTATRARVAPKPTVALPPVSGVSLRGCPSLPANDVWHADVSRLPVAAGSSRYVASIGTGRTVHADFGSRTWDGGPIGIPVTYVPGGQARVRVSFDYADESDPGPYPIPRAALVEGGPGADGDRHVLVVDTAACRLYELFAAHPNADGSWHAGSGAVYDLRSSRLRPAGWTSADAAGLPITPGLVRYEEVAAGRVTHAIRVTVPRSQNRYVWPARHAASDSGDTALPPMGLRLRLKASVNTARLPAQARIIAQAMKTYGVIVADNGSPWFIGGAPDPHWDNDALAALAGLTGVDFEAVDTAPLSAGPNTGQVR
jgi:hypothetical protein